MGILRPHKAVHPGLLAMAAILPAIAGCTDDGPIGPPPGDLDGILTSERVVHDPTGFAPLTARVDLETEIPVSVEIRVVGRHGTDSDVRHAFPGASTRHEIPILGLYPGHDNTIELSLRDEAGRDVGTRTYGITTPPLSEHMPTITIDRVEPSRMAEGTTLVSYYGHGGDPSPNRPFMFDRHGDIRWVLDYEGSDRLSRLAYSDGVQRLENGHLYFGDEVTDRIYEVDMLGRIVDTWDMPGYEFHHEVLEKPDGNFLVSVHAENTSTIEDHVIEIDRGSGQILNVWDLRESLDQDRTAWTDDRIDWIHVNAVAWDERDGTVIVSGRTQGVAKLTESNDVVWILAPHRGWGTAGDGTDLEPYLLQPLDAAGQPIMDPAVLDGEAHHPEFQWNWYQHAPKIMPNGHVLLFDNGDNRNYSGAELYSRAVEYEIDPLERTVRQVWDYGEERGAETFSPIVSEVDYLTGNGHVVFSSGAVSFGGSVYGKVVEIDHPGDQVVFEATIIPPVPIHIITFHRTERLPMYPDG